VTLNSRNIGSLGESVLVAAIHRDQIEERLQRLIMAAGCLPQWAGPEDRACGKVIGCCAFVTRRRCLRRMPFQSYS